MKTIYIVICMILCIFFIFLACEKEKSITGVKDQETKIKFLRYIDYGCANTNDLSKALQKEYYVKEHRLNKDTLTLTIHFPANCCPDFSDKVYVSENNVNIRLADKSPGCFCICEYDNDFTFHYTGGKTIRVIFRFMDFGEDGYKTRIDTLIQLDPGKIKSINSVERY